MSVFNSLTKGLEQAVQIEKGELVARTDKLTVEPVEDFSKIEIKAIRENMKLTQVIFAQLIGVSKKTVEAWESGINSPSGPAKRIISMLREDPSLPEKYHIISR